MPKRTSPTSPRRGGAHVTRGRNPVQANDASLSVEDRVLAVLRKRHGHGVDVAALPRAARLTPQEVAGLSDVLAALLRRGAVVERRGGRHLVLGAAVGLISGRLHAHPDGYAFVVTDDPNEEDCYVPRGRVQPAMHGDRVLARLERTRHHKREATIIEVLERGAEQLVGTYQARRQGGGTLRVHEDRITYPVEIPPARTGDAHDGDLVVARITRYPTLHRNIEAEVAAVLGPASDPRVETEAVIYRYGLPLTFPEPVAAAAAAMPRSVPAEALAGRLDLREQLIVTIDGENARDFDDAVGITRRAGGFRLWVSIADVAHYVAEGSALDQEALARGTSVYFPDRVIPMLPEALSNGICSLNPHVDRLTKTVRLDFDGDGRVEHTEFHNSVIRSAARLTYTDVKRILVDGAPEVRSRHTALTGMLEELERLCRLLMRRRHARGSIDFDLPEAEVILDLTGRPEAIIRAERHIGHQIIEECMLAANEAVAHHLIRHKVPLLHRVHEAPAPDAVTELARFVAGFGLHVTAAPDAVAPRDFQRLLAAVAGRPEERLINTVLLRSMKQARYAAEPLGHFGLAATAYTHFTSPIRRYPDLVVHRLLGESLQGRMSAERTNAWATRLSAIAEATSRRERVAMDAEREVIELKKIQFMQDKIGLELPGYISGVQPFGCFVELSDYFVEGLIHVRTLEDDYYEYIERAHLLRGRRSGRVLRLGDAVRVRVVAADPERRRIDFQLVEADGAKATSPAHPRSGKQPRRRQR